MNETPIDRPVRKWGRTYLYGRSRANRWPPWISWLLAPSKTNRRIVREFGGPGSMSNSPARAAGTR